jgi:acetyltransferase-like isoleucine patch superfamily enzyme
VIPSDADRQDGRRRLLDFLNNPGERSFAHPTCHPSYETGFCYCEGPWHRALRFYSRVIPLMTVLRLPFAGLKLWYLRRLGARIGRNVHFSEAIEIDPMFPQLLTLEDDVFIGYGAKFMFHEFRRDEFRAGRITIRKGAIIGAYAMIGCGVDIGELASVAGGAVVTRDVPAGAIAIGNPARTMRREVQLA